MQNFEVKGIRLILIDLVILWKDREKKRCELDLQWTVALSSQRGSIYPAFLQCSQGLSGVVSRPAEPLPERAGALQPEPAPANERREWAGFAQQHPGSGAAAPIRWQREAAGLSATPRSTRWDCSIKGAQFAINNNANFYLCFRAWKREIWGKDSFSFAYVCFVGDIRAPYYFVHMLMEKVCFSSGFANYLEYCRSCLSNKVLMIKYECLPLKMWVKFAAIWQCWEHWKGWRCFFKLQVRKHTLLHNWWLGHYCS